MPRATSLAAFLHEKTGADVELVPGSGGVFEVSLNGKTIFSKHQSGRFPDEQELLQYFR